MDKSVEGTEEWRPVAGFEGSYEVSNKGRVRSLPRVIVKSNGVQKTIHGGILRPSLMSNGYYRFVGLKDRGACSQRSVHSLVLEAFVGPRPPGFVACHNDGDSLNNTPENLRWDTQAENIQDIIRHGRHFYKKSSTCSRGHEYTDENTYTTPGTEDRICRTCRLDRQRARTIRLRKTKAA